MSATDTETPTAEPALVDIRLNRLVPNPRNLRQRVGDVRRFRNFLRDLYTHRRKNLRGALAKLPGSRHDKNEVDRQLTQIGIDSAMRAEMLDVEQHLRLCEMFG